MPEQNLSETIALLSRTPSVLDALLRPLPDFWTRRTEGETSWSPFDVVAHLIDGERNDWIPRVRMILEAGERETFRPFDRDGYAHVREGKSMAQLLDEFSGLRAANLSDLRALGLGDDDLERRGRHPAFGSVTLSQLLATWVVHDLTHLHQISRVMAHQYRDTVGPWIRYLGVLHCDAHSAPA